MPTVTLKASDQQRRFLASTADTVVFQGGARSVKTWAGALKALLLAHEYQCAGMLVAPSYPQLKQAMMPELIGIEWLSLGQGKVTGRVKIRQDLLAPNDFLHAASIIGLADTACGYGAFTHLPVGAENFTTLEVKANFLSTLREGTMACEAETGTKCPASWRRRCRSVLPAQDPSVISTIVARHAACVFPFVPIMFFNLQ